MGKGHFCDVDTVRDGDRHTAVTAELKRHTLCLSACLSLLLFSCLCIPVTQQDSVLHQQHHLYVADKAVKLLLKIN